MRPHLVTITLPDGSQLLRADNYVDCGDAIVRVLSEYPKARRISAKRLVTPTLETRTFVAGSTRRRTCADLGICQAEVGGARCASCKPYTPYPPYAPYAPGVVQGHKRPASFWRELGTDFLKWGCITAGAALVLGYASGRGWL